MLVRAANTPKGRCAGAIITLSRKKGVRGYQHVAG
jgi:hypothetical protein